MATFSFEEALLPAEDESRPRTFSFDEALGKRGLIDTATSFVKDAAETAARAWQRPDETTQAPTASELYEAQQSARMVMTSRGQRDFVTASEPEAPTINMPGSVFHGADIRNLSEGRSRLEETGGAPVRPEVVAGIHSAMERATPEERAQIAARPDWVGQVARVAESDIERDLALSSPVGGSREARMRRAIRQGASADVAANIADVGTAFPGLQEAPLAQATAVSDEQAGWQKANPLARASAAAGIGLAQSIAGAAQLSNDLFGWEELGIGPAGGMNAAQKRLQDMEKTLGQAPGNWQRWIESAITSTLTQAPGLAYGLVTGGATGPLIYIGVQQGLQTYGESRAADKPMADSLVRASIFGAAESFGEMLSLPFAITGLRGMMKGVPTNKLAASVGEFFVGLTGRELPGEMATQTVEFVADKLGPAAMHPEWTWADYVNQMKDVVMQTMLQTGMMAGGGAAASGIARNLPGSKAREIADAINADVAAKQFPVSDAEAQAIRALAPNTLEETPTGFSAATRAQESDRVRSILEAPPADPSNPLSAVDAAITRAADAVSAPMGLIDTGPVHISDILQNVTAELVPTAPVPPATGAAMQEDQLRQAREQATQAEYEARQAEIDRQKVAEFDAMQAGTAPIAPQPPTLIEIRFQEARDRAAAQQANEQAKAEAEAQRTVQEAETARLEARRPVLEELDILNRVIKHEPITDAERGALTAKGFARVTEDGEIRVTRSGYAARQQLTRQEAQNAVQVESPDAGSLQRGVGTGNEGQGAAVVQGNTQQQEVAGTRQAQEVQAPAEARPDLQPVTAPKTVAGEPVETKTTAELQELAARPKTPAITRHAAVAAIQARQNPEQRSGTPEVESPIPAQKAGVPGVAPGQAPALPEIITGKDGMAVVITQGEKGYHATLRDTDADQSVGTTIYPTLERARIGARTMLAQNAQEALGAAQPATPAKGTPEPPIVQPAPASAAEPILLGGRDITTVSDRVLRAARNGPKAAEVVIEEKRRAEAPPAPVGELVETFTGRYKQGMNKVPARQQQVELAKTRPDLDWRVESSEGLKYPFVVNGYVKEAAPAAVAPAESVAKPKQSKAEAFRAKTEALKAHRETVAAQLTAAIERDGGVKGVFPSGHTYLLSRTTSGDQPFRITTFLPDGTLSGHREYDSINNEPTLLDNAVSEFLSKDIRIIPSEGTAADLRRFAGEAGWETVGGKIIREGEGTGQIGSGGAVTGRTTWIPRREWFQRMRQDLGSRGLSDERQIQKAVDAYLAGQPLRPIEQRTVDWMLGEIKAEREAFEDVHDFTAESLATPEDLAAEGLPVTGEMAALADLTAASVEIDDAATERATIQYEGDDAGLIAELKRIINHDQKSKAAQTGAQAGAAQEEKPLLTQPTPTELKARDEAAQAAVKAEKEKEAKAKADEQLGGFNLTGSDRAADVQAAAGQKPLFAREQPLKWTAYTKDDAGLPLLSMGNVALVDPSKMFERNGKTGVSHIIVENGERIGETTLAWKDGKVTDLLNIYVASEFRRGGTASRVLEAILNHNDDSPINISITLRQAETFWRKIGTEFIPTEYGNDGTLTLAAFNDARRDRPASQSRRIPGEGIGRQAAFAQGGSRLGSAQGITEAEFRAEIGKAFGQRAERMLGNILLPLQTQADISRHAELSDVLPLMREGDRISGFYHPKTGKTYTILENLTPESVRGLVLHEVGTHYGFEGMLGPDRYAQVLRQMAIMRKAGNKAVIEAHAQATKEAARPDQVPQETIAYLVTNRPELPFVKRLIAEIKAFLFRRFGILGDRLTADDIAALARASVLHASESARNGEPMFMATAYHGTPHIWAPEPGFPHGRPRLDKIGTGEGAQAFGWGWYSAQQEGTGNAYRKSLEGANYAYVNGSPVKGDAALSWAIQAKHSGENPREFLARMKSLNPGTEREFADARKRLPEAMRMEGTSYGPLQGSLYRLDIPDDVIPNLLDWDKPLNKQSDAVKVALATAGIDANQIRGTAKQLYENARRYFESAQFPRDAREDIGIREKLRVAYAAFQQGADEYANTVRSMEDGYVKSKLMGKYRVSADQTGAEFYNNLGMERFRKSESPFADRSRSASEYLASIGIPGNKYLDQGSRHKGNGTYNYVIWDQKVLDRVALLERNGEKLDAMREAETKFARGPMTRADMIMSDREYVRNLLEMVNLATQARDEATARGDTARAEFFDKRIDEHRRELNMLREQEKAGVPLDTSGLRAPKFSRAQDQTQTPEFRVWFGESIVTDTGKPMSEGGKPLVVYHGTQAPEDFNEFAVGNDVSTDNDALWRIGSGSDPRTFLGSHFAKEARVASAFAQGLYGEREISSSGGRVIPVFLSLKNPYKTSDSAMMDAMLSKAYNSPIIEYLLEEKGDIEETGARYDSDEEFRRDVNDEALREEQAQDEPSTDLAREMADAFALKLEQRGHDGIIYRNEIEGGTSYIVFRPEQIKSAIGNTGAFSPTNPDIRFARNVMAQALPQLTRNRLGEIADYLIYNYQDKFHMLPRIQKALEPGALPESMDANLAVEAYPKKVAAKIQDFHDDYVKPFIKLLHDNNLTIAQAEEYVNAKDAPDRNREMKARNPTETELDAMKTDLAAERDALAGEDAVQEYVAKRRELRQTEADVEDGLADQSAVEVLQGEIAALRKDQNVRDYEKAIDKLKALRNIKPFVGDNTALSGMSDKNAKAIIARVHKDGTFEALKKVSAAVDAITARTRQILLQNGLAKPVEISAWEALYPHYIPRFRDEVTEGWPHPVGQGFQVRGKESKAATGSTKEVTNILAHVMAAHEAAIIRSAKVQADRALYALLAEHPENDVAELDVAPKIRDVDAKTGLVIERVDPLYKNKPNVLTLKINGDEHTITFNEDNPEALRLAASLKNLSAQDIGEITAIVGKFTRFLATMNTAANPVFTLRNFMRDIGTAYVNLSDTELAGMKKQVFADIPNAIKGFWQMTRGSMDTEWSKLAREFRDAGGQTGFVQHYKDIIQRAETLEKQLADMQPGKLNFTKDLALRYWHMIEDANLAVENGVRLSAYVNARKAGLSEAKAISLSNNLTVNFTKYGARGQELNMWYMFMNASIQGTARLVKAMGNRNVQKILGYVVASAFLLDMLNRGLAGDDDDDGENDYDQLPDYTKANNFVFYFDRPITIPMPYGYNFFASIGRMTSEAIFRKNYSAGKSAVNLANVFLDAFSPMGQSGSLLQFAAPTIADPFVQWAENRNFAGNPLRKEQLPFGPPKPEYQMGFKSTSAPAKALAEALNDMTGGNEVRPGLINMNPAAFDFAVTSILGGAGRTYLQIFSLPVKAALGEEVRAREVPIANIFASAKPEYQIERKFFENLRAVQTVGEELKHYRGDSKQIELIREQHSGEMRLIGQAKMFQSALEKIRAQERMIEKTKAEGWRDREQVLEERKRALMARFNKRYVEVTAQ